MARTGRVPNPARKLDEGAVAFDASLELYDRWCYEHFDTWVAYATNGDVAPSSATALDDIEMVVTVLVDPNGPFTSHAGIFRTENYYGSGVGHRALAIELHTFAGFMARRLYPHVRFMVTKPVPEMSAILRRGLEAGTAIVAGAPSERTASYIEEQVARFARYGGDAELERRELLAQYSPPVGTDYPLMIDMGESTWAVDGTAYALPVWMQRTWCNHRFMTSGTKDTLTHIVRIDALELRWLRPPAFGRRLV